MAIQRRQTKKTATRGTNGRSRSTRRAPGRSVAELESVIRSLEEKIADLTSARTIRSAVAGASGQVGQAAVRASHQVGDMVADSLTDFADRVRGSATSVTSAARMGTGALQKIGGEIERRPLMTVAIALGIGFLAGMAGRREAA
jgi:hypothetical protein